MHTFTHGSVRFHYNSDFSGDITIAVGPRTAGESDPPAVQVPGKALLEFLGECVLKRRLVAQIERRSGSEIITALSSI